MKTLYKILITSLAILSLVSCQKLKTIFGDDMPELPEWEMRTGYSEWSIVGDFLDSKYQKDYHMDIFRGTFYDADGNNPRKIDYYIIRNVPFKKGQSFLIRKNESSLDFRGRNGSESAEPGKAFYAVKNGESISVPKTSDYSILYFPDREAIIFYDINENRYNWTHNIPVFSRENWNDSDENKDDDNQDVELVETGYDQTPFSYLVQTEQYNYAGSWMLFDKPIELPDGYTIIMHILPIVNERENHVSSIMRFSEDLDETYYGERVSSSYIFGRYEEWDIPPHSVSLYYSSGQDYYNENQFELYSGFPFHNEDGHDMLYKKQNERDEWSEPVKYNEEEWYAIALTGENAHHKMYVDGKLVGEQDDETSRPLEQIKAIQLGSDYYWHRDEDARFDYYIGGCVYISIWNRPLSRNEIKDNIFTEPSGDGLVAFWKLNQEPECDSWEYVFKNECGDETYNIDVSKFFRRDEGGYSREKNGINWEQTPLQGGSVWFSSHWPKYKEQAKQGI